MRPARRRYRGPKSGRAQKRYGERYQQRRDAVRNVVGGTPEPRETAPGDQAAR